MELTEHGQSPEPILTPAAFTDGEGNLASQNEGGDALRPDRNVEEDSGAGPSKGFVTQLMDLTAKGESKALEKLSIDSDPNARDAWGRDALMLAAEAGNLHGVRVLLKHCDPKAVDAKGETALMMASRYSRKDCALELLKVSDVLRKNNAGLTAWGIALGSGMVSEHYMKPRGAKEQAPARKKQKSERAVAAPKIERKGKFNPMGEASVLGNKVAGYVEAVTPHASAQEQGCDGEGV